MVRLKPEPMAAAVAVATVLAKLMNNATGQLSADEQLVVEALRRSSGALATMPLAEMGAYIWGMDEASLRGLANNVKGIYHELKYVAGENGDGDGITARLFPATNHPGADVVISSDGIDTGVYQLKATGSTGPIREHLERYPDISVLTTEEVATELAMAGSSGFSNAELGQDVQDTFDQLSATARQPDLDVPASSGLMIAALATHNVLSGKMASKDALKQTGVAVTSTLLVDLLFS